MQWLGEISDSIAFSQLLLRYEGSCSPHQYVWILLLPSDYAMKSCDYIVTNVLWFTDPCILPLRYRPAFNNKIKHFNNQIKERRRPLCSHLAASSPRARGLTPTLRALHWPCCLLLRSEHHCSRPHQLLQPLTWASLSRTPRPSWGLHREASWPGRPLLPATRVASPFWLGEEAFAWDKGGIAGLSVCPSSAGSAAYDSHRLAGSCFLYVILSKTLFLRTCYSIPQYSQY